MDLFGLIIGVVAILIMSGPRSWRNDRDEYRLLGIVGALIGGFIGRMLIVNLAF
jgi:uncharacterized membrane protein YeaQ/YmgE (transglycosylase-associated protein family)